MKKPENLVLLVEGEGDVEAAPRLIKKWLTEQNAWDALKLDDKRPPLKIGGVNAHVDRDRDKLRQKLGVAAKRPNTGACLVLLDGDAKPFQRQPFCPAHAARSLATVSREVGGGDIFSVAVVYACVEYESWLLSGLSSLAGRPLKDGRQGVRADAEPPSGDLELAPRDAKGYLSRSMVSGYRESIDQEPLTDLIDLNVIRQRQMRSFRRLESALTTLVTNARLDNYVVTPNT